MEQKHPLVLAMKTRVSGGAGRALMVAAAMTAPARGLMLSAHANMQQSLLMLQGAQGAGEPQPPPTYRIETGDWWIAIKVRVFWHLSQLCNCTLPQRTGPCAAR